MDPKLESSEFYRIRFQNFSTMIIIPIFIFLLILVGASFILKKEIVIKGKGSIEPITKIINIQSTNNNAIIENYIEEGKEVNKGQELVLFNSKSLKDKKEILVKQKEKILAQQEALDILERSIGKNQDFFIQDDQYGYRQSLKNYLVQRSIYENQQNKQVYDSTEINLKLEELQYTQLQVVKKEQNRLSMEQQGIEEKIIDVNEQEKNIR